MYSLIVRTAHSVNWITARNAAGAPSIKLVAGLAVRTSSLAGANRSDEVISRAGEAGEVGIESIAGHALSRGDLVIEGALSANVEGV